MPRQLDNSVAVITGASSGIGRATALEFARGGVAVVVAARRAGPLHDLARECERRGARALAVPTDVTNEAAVWELAHQAMEHFGRLDIWVNNAAVTLFGRFEEVPSDAWRQVIETNLFGYAYGARSALAHFREQGRGVLINVASIVTVVAQPYTSAYTTSKWAVRGLTESLRQELRDVPDVHVCLVLPATIDTPLFHHAGNYTRRAIQPMRPIYDPEEVAQTIVRLSRKPQREVTVGTAGRLVSLVQMLAPRLAEMIMARQVERDHFQDRPVPVTPGNLFEAMATGTGVGGGWKSPRHPSPARAVLVGLSAVGPAVLAWRWLRPRVIAGMVTGRR